MTKLLLFCCLLLSASPTFASDLFDTAWDDYSLFAQDLAPSAQAALSGLEDAPVYHLAFELSGDWRHIAGQAEIRYTNTTPDTLDILVLRLNPNALGSLMSVTRLEVEGWTMPIQLEGRNTALRATLPYTLRPGEAVTLSLDFTVDIGSSPLGYGRFGRYQQVLSLPDAYPVLSVYRDGVWDTDFPPSQGDPLVAEASFYLARITLPAGQDLVASGRVLERSEEGGRQVVTVAAGPVRDLYLAVAEGYQMQSRSVGETILHSYAPSELSLEAAESLEVAAQAVELFSERFTPYPYRELEFLAVPVSAGGIEYPGVINLANGLYRDERNFVSVVVHEVAHQWAFNLVGNDQISEPWLDEALAQYLTLRYHQVYSSPAFVISYLNYWRGLWNSASDPEQPVGLPVAAYERGAYSPIVYGRGLFFFRTLERQLGQEVFDRVLRAYFERYAWGFVDRADLEELTEEVCGCEVSPLFEDWIGSEEEP